MAEALHSWIISLITAAIFCAVAINITPKGRIYTAIKLLCGIIMIFAIISPVINFDFTEYSESMIKYSDKTSELIKNADAYEDKLNRTFIEDKCAAYILDKAESFGAHPEKISVIAEWSADGYWYPVRADIRCNCSKELKSTLAIFIEAELGIAKERQTWTYE